VGLEVLFSEGYRRRTVMLWIFQIFQTIGYYGFGTLVSLVLAAKGYSVVNSLTYTTLAYVGYPIGSALSLLAVERIDRKWLIVGSAFLMSVLGLGLGYSTSTVMIVALGFSYTMISNVFSNALHIFQAEIFPTAIRATGAGIAYGMSRLSTAAMPFVLVPVLRTWGPGWMFALVAAALWVVILDIGLLGPATTGRTLERVNELAGASDGSVARAIVPPPAAATRTGAC
jgi:putative MFS transporter